MFFFNHNYLYNEIYANNLLTRLQKWVKIVF